MKLCLLTPNGLPVPNLGPITRCPTDLRRSVKLLSDPAAVLAGPVRSSGSRVLPPRAGNRRERSFQVLDDYFGVVRVSAPATEMFGHSVLRAYAGFLSDSAECGSDIPADDWLRIRDALDNVLVRCGADVPRRTPERLPRGVSRDPHRRWRTGHHVFFVLIQAILVHLRELLDSVRGADGTRAHQAVDILIELMAGSAAAMQFASDFSPGAYRHDVRPSMTTPWVAENLSGLMSFDHHEMISLFRTLGRTPAPDACVRSATDRLKAAVEETYDAHILVCERFGGSGIGSLRMDPATSGNSTAISALHHLRHARTGLLSR